MVKAFVRVMEGTFGGVDRVVGAEVVSLPLAQMITR